MGAVTSRRGFLAVGGAALAATLSACTTSDSLAERANAGDNKNYVAGDGSVSEYVASSRKDAAQFSAGTFDGRAIDSAGFTGQVTVLNFWFAACPPCRIEAPDLQQLYTEVKPLGVEFLGVNIRDEKAAAEAFERKFNIDYSSVEDKDGDVLLALSKFVPPASVPTTLVLDKQGRVAARIVGAADKSTLKSLIDTALAES